MTEELIFDTKLQSAKDLAWWLYIFHGLSLIFSLGLFSCLPLIVNYLKCEDTRETFVYSHHRWQIRSFWWYLFWLVASAVLWISVIGIPFAILIWIAAWIWKAYRLIKGWLDLNDNKPMPV